MIPKGEYGLLLTKKEAKVLAIDFFSQFGYYTKGQVRSNSPGDGARIKLQADDYKNNLSRRQSERYTSETLNTDGSGAIISDSSHEPLTVGKYIMDCALVSVFYRAIGDTTNAQLYATPVINELMLHFNITNYTDTSNGLTYQFSKLNFSNATRWVYLPSGTSPTFVLVEWGRRLFNAYDKVRFYMSGGQITTADLFFNRMAYWSKKMPDREVGNRTGATDADWLSLSTPWFETNSTGNNAAPAWRSQTLEGTPDSPMYFGGATSGFMKKFVYQNRTLNNALFCHLIGVDQNDTTLIKVGEFMFKEMLVYAIHSNGDIADMHRAYYNPENSTTREKGFDYACSILGLMAFTVEVDIRSGRFALANYTTTKGLVSGQSGVTTNATTDGVTPKGFLMFAQRINSYFLSLGNGNPAKYVSLTSTSDVNKLIDGIDTNLPSGVQDENTFNSWLFPVNIYYNNSTIESICDRSNVNVRAWPSNPKSIGPNIPQTGHAGCNNGVAFLHAGRRGVEASQYHITSVPQGLAINLSIVTNTTLGLVWTNPSTVDERYSAIVIEQSLSPTTGFSVIGTFTSGNPITTSSMTAVGLTANTVYYFRMKGTSLVGDSAYSAVINKTTSGGVPTIPASPSGLICTIIGQTKINLTWIDNSTNETGFKIYKSINNGAFSLLTTTSANVTTYNDTTVSATNIYQYYIIATISGTDSLPSNTVSKTITTTPINFCQEVGTVASTLKANDWLVGSGIAYTPNKAIDNVVGFLNRYVSKFRSTKQGTDPIGWIVTLAGVRDVKTLELTFGNLPIQSVFNIYRWETGAWVLEHAYTNNTNRIVTLAVTVSTDKYMIQTLKSGYLEIVEFKALSI